MAEEVGEGAGLGDRAAEVIVLVGGDHVAGFIYVFRDVAVVIECGEVELAVARHGKETAHAARALQRTGEVKAPEILYLRDVCHATVDGVDGLMDQVPVIVNEGSHLKRLPLPQFDRRRRRKRGRDIEPLHGLRRPAMAVVVGIADANRAIGEGARGNGTQLVLGVVGVRPGAV